MRASPGEAMGISVAGNPSFRKVERSVKPFELFSGRFTATSSISVEVLDRHAALQEKADAYVAKLSGGQRQRLAVA